MTETIYKTINGKKFYLFSRYIGKNSHKKAIECAKKLRKLTKDSVRILPYTKNKNVFNVWRISSQYKKINLNFKGEIDFLMRNFESMEQLDNLYDFMKLKIKKSTITEDEKVKSLLYLDKLYKTAYL